MRQGPEPDKRTVSVGSFCVFVGPAAGRRCVACAPGGSFCVSAAPRSGRGALVISGGSFWVDSRSNAGAGEVGFEAAPGFSPSICDMKSSETSGEPGAGLGFGAAGACPAAAALSLDVSRASAAWAMFSLLKRVSLIQSSDSFGSRGGINPLSERLDWASCSETRWIRPSIISRCLRRSASRAFSFAICSLMEPVFSLILARLSRRDCSCALWSFICTSSGSTTAWLQRSVWFLASR